MGGKAITMTVEGRERFPVRIRYARAFREDEESVKNLLVSAAVGGMPGAGANGAMGGSGGMSGGNTSGPAPSMATARPAPAPANPPLHGR